MDHFKFNTYREKKIRVCFGGIGVLEHQLEPDLLMRAKLQDTNDRSDLEQVVAKHNFYHELRAFQISAIIHPEQICKGSLPKPTTQ